MSMPTSAIYRVSDIYAQEQAWFLQGNEAFGLMKQAGFLLALQIDKIINRHFAGTSLPNIVVWCGAGNNGGDGYLVAYHLANFGYPVCVIAPFLPSSDTAKLAYAQAVQAGITLYQTYHQYKHSGERSIIHIDALVGIGLKGELAPILQRLIDDFNAEQGLKIALDVPSGLLADTGVPSPVAVRADETLTVIGLKMGLVTGQGRAFSGKVSLVPLLPPNPDFAPLAHLANLPVLPPRPIHAHKGDFGHVLVLGGHQTMGGAVMLAGESAFACGAGKVTIMCHRNHHTAILARSPNLMVRDMDDIYHLEFGEWLQTIDVVCFGMGLGRDEWGRGIYEKFMQILSSNDQNPKLVFDADALYFLANHPQNLAKLSKKIIATPHSAEAGRLLACTAHKIEQDRMGAICQLQSRYGGDWVLKGAGSLVLCGDMASQKMFVCDFGNPDMATAGMGDVLSGVIASLTVQGVSLEQSVAVHAKAGDELALTGQGVSAMAMMGALRKVMGDCR